MPRGRPAHVCSCQDCGKTRKHYAQGLCGSCYTKRRYMERADVPCGQCGRQRRPFAVGICRSCYTNNRKRYRKYGITQERYVSMLKEQNGRCGICSEGIERHPHVDHCHETGIIRGLLCERCNLGLGHFMDDPDRIRAAAAYIEFHRSKKVA